MVGSIKSPNWQFLFHLYTRYSPCLRLGVSIIPSPPTYYQTQTQKSNPGSQPLIEWIFHRWEMVVLPWQKSPFWKLLGQNHSILRISGVPRKEIVACYLDDFPVFVSSVKPWWSKKKRWVNDGKDLLRPIFAWKFGSPNSLPNIRWKLWHQGNQWLTVP